MPETFGPAGLEGVMEQLRAAGYGGHVDSWLSTGANQAIQSQAIAAALRPETLQRISAASGMAPEQLHQLLTVALPAMVNFWSPFGAWAPFQSGNRLQELSQLGVLLGGMYQGAHAGSMANWQAMLQGMGVPTTPAPASDPSQPRTLTSDLGTITIPPATQPKSG
jgi:hypothetical protein